jgi:hypothetical protein
MKNLCISSLVLFMAALPAQAGVRLVFESRDGNHQLKHQTRVFWEKDRGRVEGQAGGTGTVVLFHGDTMFAINEADKTYIEVTPKDLEATSEMLDQAGAALAGKMASLPPEQRAQLAKYGFGAYGFQPPPIEFKKTASGVECGKWKCDRYDMMTAGKKTAEKLFSSSLGISPSVFDGKRVKGMMEKISTGGFFKKIKQSVKNRPDGFEILSREFDGGKLTGTTELVEVVEETLPASKYEVPKGYQKRSFMQGMQGMRGAK